MLDRTLDFIFLKKHIRIGRLHGGNVMMNLRKLAKYALTTGFAFGLIAGAGTLTAKAAAPVVYYDYETQQLTVAPGKDASTPTFSNNKFSITAGQDKSTSFYFYVVVESNGKTISTERIEYKYDASTKNSKPTTVDMSGINYKKDVKIKVYADIDAKNITTDSSLVTSVDVKAQPAKITAKFNPKGESLKQIEVTAGSKLDNGKAPSSSSANDGVDAKWEYKTLYADKWINGVNLTAEKIDEFATYGATLCIRQCSTDNGTRTSSIALPTSGTISSKEVKLKIPKKANGPKATVDPVKLTVSIPAKCEWRIVGDDKLTAGAVANAKETMWTATTSNVDGWIKNETKKVFTFSDLAKNIGSSMTISHKISETETLTGKKPSVIYGATIELRTSATDKKQASKTSYVYLPAQAEAPEEETNFTWEPVINERTNTVTGLKFVNKTQKSMQVLVAERSNADEETNSTSGKKYLVVKDSFDLTKEKFTTVGANQTKVFPVSKAAEGKILIVRYTGKKANAKQKTAMELSSKTVVSEIIYPKAATKSLSVTLGADASNVGSTKITCAKTGTNNADELYYKVEDSEPTKVKLKSTVDTLGIKNQKLTSGTTSVPVSEGQYVVVYQCDKDGLVIYYGCVKVGENDIGKASSN